MYEGNMEALSCNHCYSGKTVGITYCECVFDRVKCYPFTMARRVLRLRMRQRPLTWRVAANILKNQSRTADKGCELVTIPHRKKIPFYEMFTDVMQREIHTEKPLRKSFLSMQKYAYNTLPLLQSQHNGNPK